MALSSPPRGVLPGEVLLVIHDFTARGPDELSLKRGAKIELVELDDGFGDGWYLGKDLESEKSGLFPGVYTTVAPKVPIRQQGHGTESNGEQTTDNPTLVEAIASPKSGESTPHASRHTSASDMRPPSLDNETSTSSPKQPHRSSSSPLPTSQMAIDIQQSIRQTFDGHLNGGQDSPVMNETLSVIDEHITDLSTPRHSTVTATAQESKAGNDSASEYSSTFDHRMSYINGQETDEEEEIMPSEAEVRSWNQTETSKHLRQLGIEARHCDLFEEQEITGDVLLDMDQDFIFMKEFDFGVMGKRLKTWHKIKAFQDEVKGVQQSQRKSSRSSASGFNGPGEERSLSRAGHTGPFLPRIPNLRSSAGSIQHPRLVSNNIQSNMSSPLTPQTPTWMDHSRRPSAASVRDINHSRRHSSIDTTSRYSSAADVSPNPSHRKKGSFDRSWSLNAAPQRAPARPGSAMRASTESVLPQEGFRRVESNASDSAIAVADDLDRGYFSGPEGDPRKTSRFLQKRSSVGGSFSSSLADEPYKLKVNKRHSRIGSVDSMRDTVPYPPTTAKSFTSPLPKSRFRSLSTRMTDRHGHQSTTGEGKPSFFASFGPLVGRNETDSTKGAGSLPLQQIKNAGPKFRRAVGLRAMSDIIGKGSDTSPAPGSPVRDTDPSARTGSTTPSTSKSSERHSTDGSGKATEGGTMLPRARTVKSSAKSKKDTSAYTRGLEKKSPHQQMQGCDYAGWMKKKSSNLMTTWKPRLFVLRGRRLSYYYSENDTEERGLIDITAHRVLRADHDPIVALHATITGATASPTSPLNADSPTSDKASGSEASLRASKPTGEGPFFFKLVPPKQGTSRTVQFTKPAIHYFQVDNVKEGRLWMAALMKATIERDMQLPVETSNKQRTISLKEARQMNQRPPALMVQQAATTEENDNKAEPPATAQEEESGLNIQGLSLEELDRNGDGDEEKRTSNHLGSIDTGPSLLAESSPPMPKSD
ncbi:polar growth protein [Aspergillus nanangensis]|uniref:Polar growth protein n=1 Tax=Aspergillus nanangensis TaxID=2582783 RepID=A0AAD4CCN9_ASPNN|nr:polar growth protein [Aspergillus nanangensis]